MREGTRVLRSQWETQKDVVWSFWIHTHAAHLTDLVEGRGAERRGDLEGLAAQLCDQPFQSPRYFVWVSQLRQELYEGNLDSARKRLEEGWKQFTSSPVAQLNQYKWLANSLRLCFCLAAAKALPSERERWLAEAASTSRRLRNIPETPLRSWQRCRT